jgi:urocanate reductase
LIAPRRNRNGSGLVRRLAESARRKGARILLKHEMTRIVREESGHGRVLGIVARTAGRDVAIQARKGVVVATGGHTGNVNFRRMFDPRLTEEYQQAGMPYSEQGADGELAAMEIGASLWATGTQTSEVGPAITKTRHVGTRWGYISLYYEPDSPIFHLCKATGLTVTDWHEAILVNQFGRRFWNELDSSYDFINAALANHGDRDKLNGGGPIWAIFDADAAARQNWNPKPPHVDPDGYFFTADTDFRARRQDRKSLPEAADPGRVLEETVARYNSFVTSGVDHDFRKPVPLHPIAKPPFMRRGRRRSCTIR